VKIKATHYLQRFQVAGRSGFPLDMLRHDHCYPATSHDASSISLAIFHTGAPLTITLERAVLVGGVTSPSFDRWLSFGWQVVNVLP
jgi:hypothetical protein